MWLRGSSGSSSEALRVIQRAVRLARTLDFGELTMQERALR